MIHNEDFCGRLPHEPGDAYSAFEIYRDLGPGRTITTTQERVRSLTGSQFPGESTGKLQTLLRRWRYDWVWDERAHAFDRNRARLNKTHLQALQDQRERIALLEHIQLAQRVCELQLTTADALGRLLRGEMEKTTYHTKDGAHLTTRVVDAARQLGVLGETLGKLEGVVARGDARYTALRPPRVRSINGSTPATPKL